MGVEHYEIYPAPKPFKVPRKLKIIVTIMVICALAGLAGLSAAAKKQKAPASATPVYLGYAQMVAQNYVSGSSLGLPVSGNLTTSLGRLTQSAAASSSGTSSGSTSQPSSTVVPLNISYLAFAYGSDVQKGTTTVETDTFLLDEEGGTIEQLVVVLSGEGSKVPTLGAAPTLLPGNPSTAGGAVMTGDSTSSTQSPPPQSVQTQVDAWAQAFTNPSNSFSDLYTITGDTQNRSYRGLTGYKLIGNPLIISSTPYNQQKPPTSLQLTVEMKLQSTTNAAIVTTSSYDVLVDNLSDARPNVSAWGPPGSGPTLVPFQNGFKS